MAEVAAVSCSVFVDSERAHPPCSPRSPTDDGALTWMTATQTTLCVRNTFIDEISPPFSPTFNEFYKERLVLSCPSKCVGTIAHSVLDDALTSASSPNSSSNRESTLASSPDEYLDSVVAVAGSAESAFSWGISTPSPLHTPSSRMRWADIMSSDDCDEPVQCVSLSAALEAAFFAGARRSAAVGYEACSTASGSSDQSGCSTPSKGDGYTGVRTPSPMYRAAEEPAETFPVPPIPVQEEPVRAVPRRGRGNRSGEAHGKSVIQTPVDPSLPSVGSAYHASGRCKPCAFLHTKGCKGGLNCQFCHLCGADARKIRRKEKLETRRAIQQKKKAAAAATIVDAGVPQDP